MFKHATMNRAYRLIWCEVRSTWVAVAEFARAHGKRSAAGIALSVALVAGMAGNSAAQNPAPTALPTGGQTVAGQVEIATVGSRMDVTQSSNSAIVNWDSFNIGSQAQVNFVQPSASAVILNRVLGGSGSMILGQMTANGNVFLVDPAGVIFAPGARVDVGGLVASSLGISDGNFLAAKYQFEGVGAGGAVENHGSINVANGGFVALIAPQVANKGTISAANGSIGMAAGEAVNLDFDHDGLLSFQVNFAAAAARVDNRGLIVADGGRVVMSAQAKDALLSTVLSNDGIVRARSVESRNGEIWLGGGSSGVVSVSGTLDASGTAAGQRGGTVKVLGDKVGLFEQAKVDVSGVGGGGTALVGGNWQGKGPEQNANVTYVGKDVTIIADAVGSGDGGKVVVWADGTTRFAGYVAARGGLAGGNGGTVEISGHEQLVSRGSLDLSAPNGKAGSVLFDPKNIIVANAGADPIATNDAFAENPTADATFDADLITALTNSGTAVTLQANNDITVNEAITSNNAGGNGGALTLHAGRSIAINADITTDSGDFTAIANHAGAQAADRDAGNATITMAGGTTIDAGSGAIAFSYGNGPNGNDATGAISLASLTTTGSISLASAANSGGSASTQAVSASGTISAGTLDLQSATSFTFNGNVSATTLTTAAQGYNLVLNGGATITNAVSFAHTGTLTLGNDAADVLLFDGGLTATDPSGVTLNGTVRTSGDAVSLGDGNTALTLAGTTSIIDTTNNGGTAAGRASPWAGRWMARWPTRRA
ncbi:MAG: filamentous hemagglutinin N-terminal domain-containing protein [Sulfuritalea sp.]|nr:filamentous hemagglutinin N-terminal domain-containing protein [Sulfuritalea sp.]